MKASLALLITVSSILFACQKKTECNEIPTNQSSYSIDNSKTFEINLEENSTTGYEWTWTNSQKNAHLQLLEKKYFPCSSMATSGSGGVATFSFKGIASGKDSVVLQYKRNSDTIVNSSNQKTFYVTIK